MSVTQEDISRKLNVSRSLVGRVLSNSPTVRVTDETRQKILRAAREMNYRPHAAARSLRSGKTQTIAFAASSEGMGDDAAGYMTIIHALSHRIGLSGYRLILCLLPDHARLMATLSELVKERSCDAIVLYGPEAEVREEGTFLESEDIPFVVKGRHEKEHPDWYQADYDHEGMMESAVAALWERGHRRIAFLGEDKELAYSLCLQEGFTAAMKSRMGERFKPNFMAALPPGREAAQQVISQWLDMPGDKQPTGAVIASDIWAWRGMESALADRGRRVGFGLNEFGLAGITISAGDTLVAGTGLCFPLFDMKPLGEALATHVLALVQNPTPPDPLVRLRPLLVPTTQMELGTHIASVLAALSKSEGCRTA